MSSSRDGIATGGSSGQLPWVGPGPCGGAGGAGGEVGRRGADRGTTFNSSEQTQRSEIRNLRPQNPRQFSVGTPGVGDNPRSREGTRANTAEHGNMGMTDRTSAVGDGGDRGDKGRQGRQGRPLHPPFPPRPAPLGAWPPRPPLVAACNELFFMIPARPRAPAGGFPAGCIAGRQCATPLSLLQRGCFPCSPRRVRRSCPSQRVLPLPRASSRERRSPHAPHSPPPPLPSLCQRPSPSPPGA